MGQDDPTDADGDMTGAVAEIAKQNEQLHRLLAALIQRDGGCVEITEAELLAVAPDVFVVLEPSRGNAVLRLYRDRACPTCD